MRQRLDDWEGIRQPVMEAEVPGHRATRVPRGAQNPNRAKTAMCDERVCDYAKNRIRYMRLAGVCGIGLLCIKKDSTCVAGLRTSPSKVTRV